MHVDSQDMDLLSASLDIPWLWREVCRPATWRRFGDVMINVRNDVHCLYIRSYSHFLKHGIYLVSSSSRT